MNNIQKALIWRRPGIFNEGIILDVKGSYVIYVLKEPEVNSERNIGFEIKQIRIWILAWMFTSWRT